MKRMQSRSAAGALIVSLIVAAAAGAGEPNERARPTGEAPLITIENLSGSVVIEGWEKSEVAVTGTLGAGTDGIDFSGSNERVRVEVLYQKHDRIPRAEETDLVVRIPVKSAVSVKGVNLLISASNLIGTIEAETVNGEIRIGGSPESIRARNVNGEIRVDADCPRVGAESVSGAIVLRGDMREATAETVSGPIEVHSGVLGRGLLGSVSGNVRFEGRLAARGSLEIDSHSGSVVLLLPDGLSADVEVSTFSGGIENEFGAEAERTSRYAPGKRLRFQAGAGEGRIRVQSFSGTVRLQKLE